MLPLETASADVACAGQAFHWFDLDRALDEFARVLRPRGIAIAAWNSPPEAGTWYDAVIEFLTTANPAHLPATTMDWPAALAAHPRFGGLLEIAVRHEQPTTARPSAASSAPTARSTPWSPDVAHELIDQALEVAESEGAFDAEATARSPGAASCSSCSGPSARGIARLHCACHGNGIAHKAIRSS